MITNNKMAGWHVPDELPGDDLARQVNAAANQIYRDGLPGALREAGNYSAEMWADQYGEVENAYYFMPGALRKSPYQAMRKPYDVTSVRADFPILKRRVNGRPLIWLDNSATTQKPQYVIDTIGKYYSETNSNVHRGAHQLAREATEAYEEAREKVRKFIGAAGRDEVVFVRGATEAINLVANSWGMLNVRADDEIILTEMEHHSNIVPWQMLAKKTGAIIKITPMNDRGEIMLRQYERLFTPRTRIVAAAHVSNVLGTINPIRQMADIAHRHGALILVDGAQSVPHMPINVQDLDADFFVFSGHKMYGPTGIGALWGRKELLSEMPPFQGGGGMINSVSFDHSTFKEPPEKFEAGTGNIADAVGLGAAVEYLGRIGMDRIKQYEAGLTEHLMSSLARIPGVRLIGTAHEKASVVSFIVGNVQSEHIAKYLDQRGIAIRAGHHCAQPVLKHFGLENSARASVGVYNTPDEIDAIADAVRELAAQY